MPDSELAQSVEIGGTPGGNLAAGTSAGVEGKPGTTVNIRAYADRQYVAGSSIQWYADFARALSFALDDVSRDFGADIYDRMLLDAQCRSVTNVFIASILEDGVIVRPAVDQKDADGYDQAVKLQEQVEKQFDEMDQSLDDTLWDLLDAVAVGHRVGELVFGFDSTFTGKQQYVLNQIAPRPRNSIGLVVDAYMNVLGVLGRIPGQPFGVQQGMLLADLGHVPNLLPRSKFAILTFRPRDMDPRGTSILRPAFDPWNQKQQLKREFLKYLTQFATPSVIGFTPETAEQYQLTNPDGTLKVDAYGNPVMRTPEDDMLASLMQFANGTATVFPHGALVQAIEMSGEGQAFLAAFDLFDRQITKAVLNQTLATEEGKHQTRAASGQHKDILDTVTRQAKRPVERMLKRDVLRVWLALNGRSHLQPLLPSISLGQAEQEDYATLWAGVAALQNSGYLHSSQYAELDQKLGLPERDPVDATSAPIKETVNVAADEGSIAPLAGAQAVQPPQPVQPPANEPAGDQGGAQS